VILKAENRELLACLDREIFTRAMIESVGGRNAIPG
jgi:hypothetical protein